MKLTSLNFLFLFFINSIFNLPTTVSAQPICLHPERDNLIVGKRVMIAGWGKLSHVVRSPELQYLELPLTPWEACMRIYGQTGALESPKSVGKSLTDLCPFLH